MYLVGGMYSDTGHKIPLELSTDDNDNNTDASSEFIQSQDKIILDKISKFTSDSSYIFCMPEKIKLVLNYSQEKIRSNNS